MTPKMRGILVPAAVSLILAATFIAARQGGEAPAVMLERAIQLETVDGDLAAAVDLYQRILAQSGNDRTLSAKALLRLGGCYEKLGQAEAGKVYRKLIEEYSDQPQEAETARRRLADLAKSAAPGKPHFRKIQIPTKMPPSGRLSPDGRRLAFVSNGSLWALPVHGKSDPDVAGAPVRLAEPMGAQDFSNTGVAWSVDGGWIGFLRPVWNGRIIDDQELYVVPADGGQTERLPVSWKDGHAGDVDTFRYALSAGAATVYIAKGARPEELCIYNVSARGGETKALTEPTTREPALSPDGSRIAYLKSRPGQGVAASYQVWTRPVEGGEAALVCEVPDPRWIRSPIWSPDGRMIAFLASEKANNHRQVWVVPLDGNFKPVASPSKFDLPGTTDLSLAGWTQDDKIGILIPTPEIQVLFSVPAEGGRATQLTTRGAVMPRWSSDGERIYFVGEVEDGPMHPVYVPAEGGKVTKIPVITPSGTVAKPPITVYPSQIAIAPSRDTLCFSSSRWTGEAGFHLFTMPIEGGPAVPLATSATADPSPSDFTPEWSPDGTRIAFMRAEDVRPGLKGFNIFLVPRDGGARRRISSAEDEVEMASLAWSPDGNEIAFFGRSRSLCLIPSEGGPSRVLVPKLGAGLASRGIAWSPDGKRIAYSARGRLWVVSRDGGEPDEIRTGLDAAVCKLSWSPDAKRIAFTASQGGNPELWLMGDFVHLVAPGR